MSEIKFFRDKEKTQQVYPEIDPHGNYPGVSVGLADNLTSPDGIEDSSSWIFRSAGGNESVSDGYAEIRRIIGNTSAGSIEESLSCNLIATGVSEVSIDDDTFATQISSTTGTYNFIYTPTITWNSLLVYSLNRETFSKKVSQTTNTYLFTYTPIAGYTDNTSSHIVTGFNKSTFINKVNKILGTYTFQYANSQWYLNSNQVTLSQYGITTSGTAIAGDNIVVSYNSNKWYYNDGEVVLGEYGIATTGDEIAEDSFSIFYTSNNWKNNDLNIDLATYGISISAGAPVVYDNIQVVYQAEEFHDVVITKPTYLKSIGLNEFNIDGEDILSNYTINSSGVIVSSSGSYVIFIKCLGNNTYTIYNTVASSTTRAGFSEVKPTTSSTISVLSLTAIASSGQVVLNDTHQSHYTPLADGYLCIATTDIEHLCCHLTWSGYKDGTFEEYRENKVQIPYSDNTGQIISVYGLANLDNGTAYYDEIDFYNKKWIKRTDKITYSVSNLASVKNMNVPYKYDSNYIYYGIETVEYTLASSETGIYQISDFGIEELLDINLPCYTNIFYQMNLKDKLRRDAEVVSNKIDTITSLSTSEQYGSGKAIWDLYASILSMLGLDTNTFSTSATYIVGDYVVYQYQLWKCHTAITTAGSWTGEANWEVAKILTDGQLGKAAHPIGSYYWSSVNTDPGLLFGGTWQRIKDKFILAAGNTYTTIGATGGETRHTLTEGELPQLYGSISMHGGGQSTVISTVNGICKVAHPSYNLNKYRDGGTERNSTFCWCYWNFFWR